MLIVLVEWVKVQGEDLITWMKHFCSDGLTMPPCTGHEG